MKHKSELLRIPATAGIDTLWTISNNDCLYL